MQQPSVRSVPPRVEPDEDSPGALAAELAATAGLHLDDWQRLVLLDALAQKPDGRWAAREVGLIVPRQNGKGSVLEALELAALFLPEPNGPPPLVLHSAHEYKTADEHFRRMRDLVDGSDRLRSQVRIVRTASGAQAIELHTGARLRFVTRTSGSGRGFSADVVIMDEAYNLSDESMAAVLPTLSARPNPQIWYTSSAGMLSSSVLTRVRRRGRSGKDGQLAYFEWCADDGADLDDPQVWAQANPALGIRIDVESIAGERAAMPDEQFGRERLGLWADAEADQVIDPAAWAALADRDAKKPAEPVFGVALSKDQSSAAIAAAGRRADGMAQVSILDAHPRTDWVVDRLVDLSDKTGAAVALDKGGPAGSLLRDLQDRRVKVVELTQGDYAQACGALLNDVNNGLLRHVADPALDKAVETASTRPLADRWAWSRKTTDISPLEAATVALHGYRTQPTTEAWGFFE